MKKTLIILLSLLCIVPLFAQSAVESTKPENSTLDEMRIISLAPNVTEMVYALGAGDQLVGRTDYCNFPAEALEVTSIGSLWDPNMETILALDADVAIATSIVDPTFIENLNKAGVQTYQFYEEDSFDKTDDLIREVAHVIGRDAQAEAIIADMNERIQAVEDKVSAVEDKKSVVFIIGYGDWGDFAATGDTFVDGVLQTAGGINVAKDGHSWSISKELLVQTDPDVIIISISEGMDAESELRNFTTLAPYCDLTASETGHVYTIDGDSSQRQGVRTVDTVEEIARMLYPELF